MLEFPSPIDPHVPYRGRQGLWAPPADLVEELADIL